MTSSPQPTTARRQSIWLADDSVSERELAQRVLAPDFDVRVFADGESLVEALSQDPLPNAVVLDWMMPGISGVEICRYMRTNPATVRMPALLLTSNDRPEDVAEGLDAGANDFVIKPFQAVELLARLRSLLRTDALRARAERAEEVSRALIEGIPDALITLGAERRVTYVNAAAERMLGKPRDQLLGKPAQAILPGLEEARIPDVALETITLADLRREDRTYSAVVRPMMMPSGLSMALSLRDVTAQRQIEARRLDFYSVIAHELRSPLTAVSLRVGLMLRGKGGTPSDEHKVELVKMGDRLRILDELIGDFLDLARMDASGLKLNRAPLSMGALVHDVASEFNLLAEAAGVQLNIAASPAVGDAVLADGRRLRQVVFNLMSNAIKFTPTGGSVTASVVVDPESVTVLVKDTGPGIAAEAVSQLFNRYARAEDVSEKIPGTGLGLMIVREIVEAHGGTVGVNTAPGRGSAFWFRLPASAP